MKAIIATAAGVLVLGGVLVATSGRTTNAQAPATVQPVSSADRPTLVNCGEGRQAVVYPNAQGSGFSQVECVARGQALAPQDPYGRPFPTIDNGAPALAMGYAPVQYAPVAAVQTQPVVQERIVYRDRPVTSSRTVRRSSPTYSRASTTYEPARRTRSWKKSAVIIGGSTAGGAGVGALLGGKSGAKKGAVAGLVGGTIYDIATRNKH
jgi:hypothetical protein